MPKKNRDWTRRDFVASSSALPIGAATVGVGSLVAGLALLQPTPACGDDDVSATPTPKQTEGPYFKPKTPLRASLVDKEFKGKKLIVQGRVISTTKSPVAKALLDFWHANEKGEYDNDGFNYRGHLFSSDNGKFRLETILPGLYPGRTRHIHVKVQAPDNPVLTTQLYFPGEKNNAKDRIFNKVLVVKIERHKEHDVATFDFVLKIA